ncbi:acetoacetate decarboxylase family protein [Massilia niastensis]|uniref:acetoacetate decarboxylase family protein n=1 Tax=Massilia niastensis TaxID=544911 RepID=UPI0003A087BA|nr:acetoacetate decarboxylase family protein [Massilia niastensis]
MNLKTGALVLSVSLPGAAASHADTLSGSEPATPSTRTIDIADYSVPVVAGGLYDRYRSNTPLSVVQAEAPGVDVSWFRTIPKVKLDVGFETYSPNFYYKNRRITAIFTADIERLRKLMPVEVMKAVQPVQLWPGRGVVALTAYEYQYCDNDSYNEISLSIVTTKPGTIDLGPVSLLRQAMSDDYWGYVLKLPVNTELARVRGIVGYNLPKWLTGIDIEENGKSLTFTIADSQTGKADVVFRGEKLGALSNEATFVKNSFTNLDASGRLTTGHTLSRQLRHASSKRAESAGLQLSDGSLSSYIKSLKLGKMLKYEYVPDFQSALYAPTALTSLSATK